MDGKQAGTWCLALGMPIAVTLWTYLWIGARMPHFWPVATVYAGFWALQWALWAAPPALVCTLLCAALAVARTCIAYTATLPTLWPAFVTCGNAWGLAWSLYFYWSSSGAGIRDWYCGKELRPLVAGVDVKLFIVSRIGMATWALAVLHAYLSWDTCPPAAVAVSTALQLCYLFRFFTWEREYTHTMDQQHDRAGFYVCWGCLAYVPAVYWTAAIQASADMYTGGLGTAASWVCGAVGLACIYAVHVIDEQKTRVRANQYAHVAGRPATWIRTRTGSLLLTCGGWGVARHLHYLFELGAALAWTAPVAGSNLLGYAYVLYLAVLLVHRTYRDDERCAAKYGADWETYCKAVPYRICPGIF
jgi:7-dehydrocholesterol reductase